MDGGKKRYRPKINEEKKEDTWGKWTRDQGE